MAGPSFMHKYLISRKQEDELYAQLHNFCCNLSPTLSATVLKIVSISGDKCNRSS